MENNKIINLKKEIKDILNQYQSNIDNDVILTGALSKAVELSARLQVYLEIK